MAQRRIAAILPVLAALSGASAAGLSGAPATGFAGTAAAPVSSALAALPARSTALSGAPARAQEAVVDRWLVTGAEVEGDGYPLLGEDVERFPDRNLETESGRWALLREDGQARFDLSGVAEAGQAALAHAYLRTAFDIDVRLTLEGPECAALTAWLNAQPIVDADRPREVRLGAGWNTLLVALEPEAGCEPSVSARMLTLMGPNIRDEEATGDAPTVQASRPPGVRPNYPNGVVTVGTPQVRGLAWTPGADDLAAIFGYELTSWGVDAARLGEVAAPGVQRLPGRFQNPMELPRRGGRRGGGAGEGRDGGGGDADEGGPSDPEGMRASMIAQLRGRPEAPVAAPVSGSVDLRLAGERFVAAADDLQPGVPVSFEGSIRFRRLREAALREDGMKAEFRFQRRSGQRDDGEGEGRMPAEPILLALHAPIRLDLADAGGGVWRGELRVPDALAGFTVRGDETGGSWSVDGAAAEAGVLCDPCQRGRRLAVEFRGTPGRADEPPRAIIAGPGLPDLPAGTVSAVQLLRALEGDNRRYHELIDG